MTKWLVTFTGRDGVRWNVVQFGGKSGGESRGIVDLMAIRKNHAVATRQVKRGDLFEIVLIQTKGGLARKPTSADRRRLAYVAKHYHAKDVLLATWQRGRGVELRRLVGANWVKVTPEAVFGKV